MQVLSIWPPKADISVVTQLDFELGSSCNSIKRRKNPSPLFVSSNSRAIISSCSSSSSSSSSSSRVCFRNPILDFGCGSLYKYSAVKFYVFCVPNIDSFDASVALALAPEEQEFGGKVVKQDSNSLDGLSESEVFSGVHSEGLKQTNLNLNVKNEHRKSNQESVKEKRSARIDVRALGLLLRLAKTANDVDEVLKDMGEIPPQVYSSLIRGFGKDNRVDSAMALVEWLKRKKKEDSNRFNGPNLFIYNSLLGALKQAEKYEEVDNVINDMAVEGVSPNVVTYNTLMGIYLEQGKEIEALNLFNEIETKGLSPSPASYSTALLAYRRLEDGFGALKFYVDVKEKYLNGEIGKDTNEYWESEFAKLEDFIVRICYQVMRRWLVKRENLSTNVLKLLTDMDKAGLQTGRAELERLVWACTREEHYVVAKELYNRIRERDSEISLSVCNHVIWVMGKAKKWWAALEIYEDLLDKGPQPNNMSYELVVSHFNTLLTAARRKGIWKWGVRLLNKMEEKGLKPGSKEWNSVLAACSKASETSAAVQIFKRMVERGEKPNVISYGALLSALEKGKLYDEALQVWKHMLKVGIEPNLYAYTIMSSVYAAQGKFNIVESIIQEMVTSGVGPTVVTFNAIITASARNNMGNEAYEWFQRMKVENIEPNEVSYEMLIEALANDGKPRLAYDLYLRANIEGLNLSSKAYDAVVRSSEVYGASVDLSALGPRPPEKAKKVKIRKNLSEFCNLADVPRRGKPFDRKEISTPQTEGNF